MRLHVLGSAKLVIAGAAVALAATACGGGGGGGAQRTVRSGDTIVADDASFDASVIELTAGRPSTLRFRNEDSMPHNIVISPEGGEPVFDGEVIEGGSVTYRIPALEAGDYEFVCELHSNMTGTVAVAR